MKQLASTYFNLIRNNKNKSFLFGLLLILFNIIFTTYNLLATDLARGVHFSLEKFALVWSSGGSGTFFPWPQPSGMVLVITYSQNLINIIIWFSAISGLLFALSVLFWTICASMVTLPIYYSFEKMN
ncbi:MAG: hypothetical protein HeimC3_37520 [Candidatus Heimdallarchaeota archaeon LC_3]|nr:MAG: hypothetical protein HeimC3_37520 [Candidatus Heimdallarchaeota archaeon LC_3]